MSVHILPQHHPIGQSVLSVENHSNSDEIAQLKAKNELLQRENAQLRRYRHDVRRVIRMNWNANTKLVYLELVTTANDPSTPTITHKNKSAARIESTARACSDQLHISNKTAANAIHQLQSSNPPLLEWQKPDTVLCDRNGRTLDKKEARQVSPKEIGKGKAYHYQKGNGVLYVPDPPPLLPRIEQTNYDKGQREKATNERARLKQALEIIEKASCPECGTVGELRAVCRGCGSAIESTNGGEFHTDHPHAATCEFHIFTTDTNPPPKPVATDPQPDPAEKITQLNTEGENFTHPPLPMPCDDSPAARVLLWLELAIGEDRRVVFQNKERDDHKYLERKGAMYDLRATLAGNPRHIYAVRPRLVDGKAWVLFADNDKDEERLGLSWEELTTAAHKLRTAGLYTILLRRKGEKARLWWLYDRPINPAVARRLILLHAPELEVLKEWFPVGKQQRQPVSYSLTRLEGPRVVSCPLYAVTDLGVVQSDGWLCDEESVAYAFDRSVNRADLVEALPLEASDYAAQLDVCGDSIGGGLVSAVAVDSDYNHDAERDAAIQWKKAQLHPRDLGLPESGYFTVPQIRAERTPSFHWDYDEYGQREWICTDHGPSKAKYDIFDLWVAIKYDGLSNKKRAIADACRDYRNECVRAVAAD